MMAALGLSPVPAHGYYVVEGPQWRSFAGQANANDQIGAYATPRPTQVATNWPGVQLRCGVEGMEGGRWMSPTGGGSDLPYFQQTTFPQRSALLLMDGGRPGQLTTPASIAGLFGPKRVAQAAQAAANAAGQLGF